jgi:peptide/nickel transport system permease protein
MHVWTVIARRVLLSAVVLLLVSLVTFSLMHAVPGDPIDAIIGERQADQPDVRANFERLYGLDKPLPVQYLYYLKNLAQGDMGISISTRQPVTAELRQAIPATIELAVFAMVIALALGVPLGIVAAARKDQWPDKIARLIAVTGASIPSFWCGLLVAYLFSYHLQWFPRSGQIDIGMQEPASVTGFMSIDALLGGEVGVFTSFLRHIALPAIVLAILSLGIITRMLRSSLITVLNDDYIRTARAKGLPEQRVLVGHALRNALIPTVTVVGLTFSSLLTGAAIVETLFSWPGLGQFAVRMAFNFDYPGMIGATLAIAVMYIVVSLIVDVTYTILDPRIRVA